MFEMNVMAMSEMIIVIIIIHRKEMHEWFIVYRDNDQYAHFAIKTFITSSTCSLIDPRSPQHKHIYTSMYNHDALRLLTPLYGEGQCLPRERM